MEYTDVAQTPSEYTNVRFSLIKEGKNMLIVIGYNPSTADSNKKDPTMGAVVYHAGNNGYDGFVMLNLYPLRSTKPSELPKEMDESIHLQNMEYIKSIFSKYPKADVLVAYGNLVSKRKYTKLIAKEILQILKDEHRNTLCLYRLKTGNPKHPLMAPGNIKFQPFEIQ